MLVALSVCAPHGIVQNVHTECAKQKSVCWSAFEPLPGAVITIELVALACVTKQRVKKVNARLCMGLEGASSEVVEVALNVALIIR